MVHYLVHNVLEKLFDYNNNNKIDIFTGINTKFDDIDKPCKASPSVTSQQPQLTATTSKNQGSRSTATFTALPFKARYQRVTKKRPRSSAINTMSM